jgi:hypothetical protein
MLADALEDVDQVRVDVNAVEPTSHNQALHDADLFGAQLGPTKIPILSAHWNNTQRALQMVGVQRHLGVGEKYFQPQPPLTHIVESFRKGCGGA